MTRGTERELYVSHSVGPVVQNELIRESQLILAKEIVNTIGGYKLECDGPIKITERVENCIERWGGSCVCRVSRKYCSKRRHKQSIGDEIYTHDDFPTHAPFLSIGISLSLYHTQHHHRSFAQNLSRSIPLTLKRNERENK